MPNKKESIHSQSIIDEARLLYSQGLNYNKIAIQLNINRHTVKRWIENKNLIGRPSKEEKIQKWITEEKKYSSFSDFIVEYIWNKYDNKCSSCGWCEINQWTNKSPLEIDHIDGDDKNNKEPNLVLLCPNCHALTPTFQNLNRLYNGKTRLEILALKEKALELIKCDLSINKISKRLGINQGLISNYLIAQKAINRDNYDSYIQKWQLGEVDGGGTGKNGALTFHPYPFVKIYLLEKYNNSCSICQYSKQNPYSKDYVLQVDHIDGNRINHKEENLRLICNNCHSLTETFRDLNKSQTFKVDKEAVLKRKEEIKLDSENKKAQKELEKELREPPHRPLANYSDEELAGMLQDTDLNLSKLSKQLKCSATTLKKRLVKANLYQSQRPWLVGLKKENIKYSNEELYKLLQENDMNYSQLSKKINCSPGSIRKRLKKDNYLIELKPKYKIKCSDQELFQLLQENDMKFSRLGKLLNYDPSSLKHRLVKAGLIEIVTQRIKKN